jgi:hypothetical protein
VNAQRSGIRGEPFPEERYEALRDAALGGATTAATNARGMAVFMRDGMAGWMRAWRDCVAAARARESDARGTRSAPRPEMVAVLVQMAWAAAREEFVT